MASAPCCAAGPPLQHEYTPKGVLSLSGDLPMYTIKSEGNKGIILVPDIFSWPSGPGYTGLGSK